jgi:hypothetical protein
MKEYMNGDNRNHETGAGLTLKHPIALLLFLSWLPLTIMLYPLPTYRVIEQSMEALYQPFDGQSKGQDTSTRPQERAEKKPVVLPDPEQVHAVWVVAVRDWVLRCVALAAGLSASVMTAFTFRRWRLALVLSSLFYLTVIMEPYSMLIPTWENATFWWTFARNSLTDFTYAFNDVAFPLIQAAVLITLAVGRLRSTEGGGGASEGPAS